MLLPVGEREEFLIGCLDEILRVFDDDLAIELLMFFRKMTRSVEVEIRDEMLLVKDVDVFGSDFLDVPVSEFFS